MIYLRGLECDKSEQIFCLNMQHFKFHEIINRSLYDRNEQWHSLWKDESNNKDVKIVNEIPPTQSIVLLRLFEMTAQVFPH